MPDNMIVYDFVVLKKELCKYNNDQIFDNTKNTAK